MDFAALGNRLYRGETSVDIVSRSKLWYKISAVILGASLLILFVRPLALGIEFTGGAEFTAAAPGSTAADVTAVTEAVQGTELPGTEEVRVTLIGSERIRVQTGELSTAESTTVAQTIADTVDIPVDDITVQVVGPSWGDEITRKALQGLVAFLLLVTVFIVIVFEPKMAIAALAALAHDVIATIGVYALVGFDVTPASIIGLLTILGYSLYDTVVVFDKVRENTRGITAQTKYTYAEAANLAVNQTLVRSINTSIIGLLPVGAILFVGAGLLGAGTLKDVSLALFVGVAVGTYSSIFIATPLLVDLKRSDPTLTALERRVLARRSGADTRPGAKVPVGAAPVQEPAAGPATEAVGEAPAPAAHPPTTSRSGGGERRQPSKQSRSQRRGPGGRGR